MRKSILIICMICVLTVLPFIVNENGSYEGADGQAEELITQVAPDYKPWFEPWFEPASGEIESLLFTLQGLLGAAVIFYIFGYYQGRRSRHADHR
ncbi:energy-coupling factor ABC transporter substrate-binding protein [Vibrio albus]|uniref:Cobalt transport protein CbiN n=1 Tax=Vibrio albus TaxID=2200953 RepID=A0A2U3B614_9VIBR|nr:energy-coupling factor ABC transporter substrate-binding protein [Vibrio albus]PWI32243.1 energy-coupling factor ABC transporter substrate-binding protein [Vibrio albus]